LSGGELDNYLYYALLPDEERERLGIYEEVRFYREPLKKNKTKLN
jgi:hypothetical protein